MFFSISLFKKPVLFTSLIGLVAVLTLQSHVVYAENVYISDRVFVPMRKGGGKKFGIVHKGLPSGTRVTLIERDGDWTKVRTAGGTTGWIPSQYASRKIPPAILLATANKKLEQLQQQNQKLTTQLGEQEKILKTTQTELSSTNRQSDAVSNELSALKAVSSSAVETRNRLQSITQKLQLLQTENDVLRSENESLQKSERSTFFMYGMLAVIMGVIITLIVPRLKFKRRNSQWIN